MNLEQLKNFKDMFKNLWLRVQSAMLSLVYTKGDFRKVEKLELSNAKLALTINSFLTKYTIEELEPRNFLVTR